MARAIAGWIECSAGGTTPRFLLAERLVAAERDRVPNIILIVADDLGWGDVGFNGRREWSTPNLDRLAKEGRVLERCYTAGGGVRSQPRGLSDWKVDDPLGRSRSTTKTCRTRR